MSSLLVKVHLVWWSHGFDYELDGILPQRICHIGLDSSALEVHLGCHRMFSFFLLLLWL